MVEAIMLETGGTPRRVRHLTRRWVFLRPAQEDLFPGRRPALAR